MSGVSKDHDEGRSSHGQDSRSSSPNDWLLAEMRNWLSAKLTNTSRGRCWTFRMHHMSYVNGLVQGTVMKQFNSVRTLIRGRGNTNWRVVLQPAATEASSKLKITRPQGSNHGGKATQ